MNVCAWLAVDRPAIQVASSNSAGPSLEVQGTWLWNCTRPRRRESAQAGMSQLLYQFLLPDGIVGVRSLEFSTSAFLVGYSALDNVRSLSSPLPADGCSHADGRDRCLTTHRRHVGMCFGVLLLASCSDNDALFAPVAACRPSSPRPNREPLQRAPRPGQSEVLGVLSATQEKYSPTESGQSLVQLAAPVTLNVASTITAGECP